MGYQCVVQIEIIELCEACNNVNTVRMLYDVDVCDSSPLLYCSSALSSVSISFLAEKRTSRFQYPSMAELENRILDTVTTLI